MAVTFAHPSVSAEIVGPAGSFVYVSAYDQGRIVVLDDSTYTIVDSIDVNLSGCSRPFRTALSADGAKLIASCYVSDSIVVIDTATRTVSQVIDNLENPSDVAYLADGEHVLVGQRSNSGFYKIHLPTATVEAFAAPRSTRSIAVHPFRDVAYMTSLRDVIVVDVDTGAILDTVNLNATDIWDVVVSRDGDRLYATDRYGDGPDGLYVIDTATNEQIGLVGGLGALKGVEVAPDGSTVYVATFDDGRISFIDAAALTETGSVALGAGQPGFVALTCDGAALFATTNGVSLKVVDTPSQTLAADVDLNSETRGVAACPPTFATGVVLSPAEQTRSAARGESVMHALTVHNRSAVTTTYTVEAGASAWPLQLSAAQVGPLPPNATAPVTATVQIPAGAAWYTEVTTGITATSTADPSVFAAAQVTSRAYAAPRLEVSPDQLSQPLYVGEAVSLTVSVNNGNGVTGTLALTPPLPPVDVAVAGSSAYPIHYRLETDPALDHITFTDIGDDFTVAALVGRDAVVVAECDECVTVREAEALEAFGAAGGSVVLGMDFMNELSLRALAALQRLFGIGAVGDGDFDFGALNTDHPIGQGLGGLSNLSGHNNYYDTTTAEWVVQGTDGNNYVVANNTAGRAVALGENLPPWWDANAPLVRNALLWSTEQPVLPAWLSVTPDAGVVRSDSALTLTLGLNAIAVQPGSYEYDLLFTTNDPISPTIAISTAVTVSPTDTMGWVEGVVSDSRTGAPLVAQVSAAGAPFLVETDEDGTYTLWLEAGAHVLQAVSPGYVDATVGVTITAGAGVEQEIALNPKQPIFSVAPETITIAQAYGEVATATMTISNTGAGVMTYHVVPGTPTYHPAPNPMAASGPDAFGYVFHDSTEFNGPRYNWEEIADVGTLVTGWSYSNYDDGYAGAIPLGFVFNYYGNDYDALYVSTNGYVTFGYGNDAIPYGTPPRWNGPNNDIALFGGDRGLDNYGTDSKVLYTTLLNPTRFVLQFENLYDCCGPYPFGRDMQLILYPNGNILVNYKALGGTTATYVGIENADGSVGLGYDGDLTDELAICYAYPGNAPSCAVESGWLTIAPAGGDIQPGQSAAVFLTLDATAHQPGTYDIDLTVRHDDPLAPFGTVSVSMAIEPASGMGVVAGSIADAWRGDPVTATVALSGIYTATEVTEYAIWGPSGTHELVVSAAGYVTAHVPVTLLPGTTITADVALEPLQPRLELSATAVDVTLVQNDKITVTLSISNTGWLPLTASINERAAARTVGSGHVVAMSDDRFNDNTINRRFANNVFAWLADPGYSDVPWLSADPASLTVAPNSAQTVAVTLDATALNPDTYAAELVLEHNDLNQDAVVLPVTLEVITQTAGVTVALSASADTLRPGDTRAYTVTVTNTGTGPDSFALSADSAWGGALADDATPMLAPGAAFETTLTVTAPAVPLSDSDAIAVQATSLFDPLVTDTRTLTLTLAPWTIYLPFAVNGP